MLRQPRMIPDLADRVSLVLIAGENVGNEVSGVFWNRFVEIVRTRKNFLVEEICLRVFEGEVATNHSKQNYTTRPDIDSQTVVFLAFYHLGGGVTGRTAGSFQLLSFLVGVGKPEINNFDVLFSVEKNVFRFEVSVDNSNLVDVLDAGNELVEHFGCFGLLETLAVDNVVKEFPFLHELHDEEELFGCLDDFI